MTQALTKPLTYKEFIEWYPNNGKQYELHDGVIIEMAPPSGEHEDITGFLARKIGTEFEQLSFRKLKTLRLLNFILAQAPA
ncbi:MAG: Uma2 family endonuclease [Calothrix sp. C42_A2020_038]|nr:Uma2 family endonuclease [Calothrix sp. C42_A2020_038]